jgi:hypothetical protein
MNTTDIRVPVLGTQDDAFFCPPELFTRAAVVVGGHPLWEPPPFACPCTDGILIIYTLRRSVRDGTVDIHGGYILMTRADLEKLESKHHLCTFWRRADKPADMATMLKELGFGETRLEFLN